MVDEPVEADTSVQKQDEWWTELAKVKADADASNQDTRQRLEETRAHLESTSAELAAIKLPPAQITKYVDRSVRPWWAPDAQGMLAGGILFIAATALFVRMLHTSQTEDKMLDTMITILFSTCLVTVYQYTFGSSRGSDTKTASQDKLVEKLVPPTMTSGTSATTTTTTVEGKT